MKKAMYRIEFRDKQTNNVTEISRGVYYANGPGFNKAAAWANKSCERQEYVAAVAQESAESTD